MRIRAVVFDLDGTLVETAPDLHAVLAVQTEDLAVQRDGGFELLGRAPLAEPRGCSLLAA